MLQLDNGYVAVHSVLPTFLCALDSTAMYFTNITNKPDYYYYIIIINTAPMPPNVFLTIVEKHKLGLSCAKLSLA